MDAPGPSLPSAPPPGGPPVAPGGGPGSAEGLLLHYWHVLLKRRWVVAAFASMLVASTTVGTLLATPYYAATAVIEISPKTDTILEVEEVSEFVTASSASELRNYYATQYKVIQSRSTIDRALRLLREEHAVTDFDEAEKPIDAFRANLTVQPVVETHLVHITVEYPDPAKAALFADVLAQAYIEGNLQRAMDSSQRALDWLSRQANEYKDKKYKSDMAVHAFRTENDLMGSGEKFNSAVEKLDTVQAAWSAASTERIQVEAIFNELSKLARATDQAPLAQHLAVGNDVLSALLSRQDALRQERSRLSTRVGDRHPDMVRVDSELNAVEAQIRRQVTDIVAGKRAELEVSEKREAALYAELQQVKAEVQRLDGKLIELKFLEAEALRNESFYQSIGRRLSEVDLGSLLRNNNIRLVDAAVPGDSPVRPKLAVNMVMGLLLGLFGGTALAFLLEFVDNTVKSREDVESVLGVPLLGVVPGVDPPELMSLATDIDRSLFVFARPRSTVAECLRSIRTNVMFRTPQRKVRRLLITSAAPREGKSFTSSNLAAIIAMTGNRVLLIDADMRRPALHKRFGLSNDQGLVSLFTGEATAEEIIQPTHIPGLDVAVAGPPPPNPGELLGGDAMARFLAGLRGYDFILIDSPPVNVVADPLVLSSLVDGVLLVVEANRTTRAMVRQAGARLAETHARILGAVVNKLNLRSAGYGYSYYDTYGYYYTEAEEEGARGAG
jgi:capsular exopolysaccharide synthesis family protein